MKVTVYSTPNCVQCLSTKKMLDKAGVVYDAIDLTQHPELADQFREAGHTQAPIVIADDLVWSGFRHGKITALITRIFGNHEKA